MYIFFVISGYALSYKPLRLARKGQFDEAASALSSSIFRRHFRLFVPTMIITLLCAIMTQLDWYGKAEDMPGVAVPAFEPPRLDNLWSQLEDFVWNEIRFMDPIGRTIAKGDPGEQLKELHHPYNYVLWTLPVEFHSSMVLMTFLMATSRIQNGARMVICLALAFVFQYVFIYWALFLFFSGTLICEFRLELDEILSRRPSQTKDGGSLLMFFFGRTLGAGCFMLSLWALSTPHLAFGGREAPGFRTIASLIPGRFGDQLLMPIAAICLVFTIDHTPFLQVLFTNKFAQYMGKISFSLSLIHGPLLNTLGHLLGRKLIKLLGGHTDEKYFIAIALAAMVWWITAILLADFVYRYVDFVSVQVSRWAYEKLLPNGNTCCKEE